MPGAASLPRVTCSVFGLKFGTIEAFLQSVTQCQGLHCLELRVQFGLKFGTIEASFQSVNVILNINLKFSSMRKLKIGLKY